MTSVTHDSTLTANGEYVFPENHIPSDVVELEGVFDGATATLGYSDSRGNFVPFYDAQGSEVMATSSRGWTVTVPVSGRLAVKVTNAGGSTAIQAKFRW